jgi:gliding motility-associated lipoprotein GldD
MIRTNRALLFFAVILMTALLGSCGGNSQPRPRGYFRIDLPEKEYIAFDSTGAPFTFEYPAYGIITPSDEKNPEPWWFNIEFPHYKAKLHISYKSVGNNLALLMEDAYSLTYNHTVKADAIQETALADEENNISGLLYNLKGNTATAVQFYLTDSTRHFMRGSLYFFSSPNEDSLKPVIDFFREDIIHLMETVRWKN